MQKDNNQMILQPTYQIFAEKHTNEEVQMSSTSLPFKSCMFLDLKRPAFEFKYQCILAMIGVRFFTNFLIREKILLEAQLGFLLGLEIMPQKPLALCVAHDRSIISGNYYSFSFIQTTRKLNKSFKSYGQKF